VFSWVHLSIPEEPTRVAMLFCARALQSQRRREIDRNGNNESALLFSTGAYRGSNTGHMILAKGCIMALSDFLYQSSAQ
jgi:hypothetical protein